MAKIKFRRDTAANWTSANPILAQGEPGFEHDTGLLKIGDGETAWVDLDYNSGGGGLTDDQEVKITVGNNEYWAMTNRANNDSNGVESSAVIYDSENNVIMLHISNNAIDEANQPVISKFNNAGVLLWQKQIQENVNYYQTHDLAVDSSDNIYVSITNSSSTGINGDQDMVILKFNSAGTLVWQQQYHPQDGEVSSRVTVGSMSVRGSNIFVAGWYVADINNTFTRGFIMRASTTDGALSWFRAFDHFGRETEVYGMEVGADGNPVVVGRIYGGEGPQDEAFVTKFAAADGAGTWTNSIFDVPTGTEYSGGDVTIDGQNNVYVSVNSSQDIVTDNGYNDRPTVSHVVKLNSLGAIQWTRRIGPGPCATVGTGIDCDSAGNVYLSALTTAQPAPIRDEGTLNNESDSFNRNVLAIAKYNTAGAVLWQRYIETDHYYFMNLRDSDAPPGIFNYQNRGRNLSISTNGKIAVQASVRHVDLDDIWENTNFEESITFQIDQDGREMTVGTGSNLFKVKESRIPGRMITVTSEVQTDPAVTNNTDIANVVGVTTADFTFFQIAELAQELTKTAPYEYVFGNDGTLTMPNDGDLRLTQAELGWFSIFGPANNNDDDVYIHGHCVDPVTGDVYLYGEDNDDDEGFVARFNSQGQVQWSIVLYDLDDGRNSFVKAAKLHPTNGHLVVLLEENSGDDSVAIFEIDVDTAQIVRQAGFRDLSDTEGCTPIDFDFLSDESLVIVGEKYGEYITQTATPRTGSAAGLLVVDTADVTGTVTNSWRVSGSGIAGKTPIERVNEYTNVATTVREGSGAVFDVINNGNGTYSALIVNGGTNYLAGHKIKILGTALGGATPDNDIIITADAVDAGVITSVSNTGTAATGLPTYTYASKFTAVSNDRTFYIKPDGTQMYTLVTGTLTEYTLNTPWDISTATSTSTADLNLALGIDLLNGVYFKPDGTELYVFAYDTNSDVRFSKITLATPWNIGSTPTYVQGNTIAVPFAISLEFKDDGTKFYSIYSNQIRQWNLGSAWDISGVDATPDVSYDFNTIDTIDIRDVAFSADGTSMYATKMPSSGSTWTVVRYQLSTAWDISTAVLTADSIDISEGVTGFNYIDRANIAFKPDRTSMYIAGFTSSGARVVQFNGAGGGGSTTYEDLSGANHNVGSGATLILIVAQDTGVITYAGFSANGSNYVADDVLTVAGTVFATGTSPANDAQITITAVDGSGTVAGTDGVVTGTAPTGKLALFTTAQVDYSGEGAWLLNQPLDSQGFIARTTPSSAETFALTWTKVIGGASNDFDDIESVMVDADDNIYVAGQVMARNNAAGSSLNNTECAVVAKFNSAGTLAWSKALNESVNNCEARSIAVRGNTVAVAHYNGDNSDVVITKLTTAGVIQWQRRFDVNESDCSVAIDTNGDIYAVGEALMESQYERCIKVIRLNSGGEPVWRKILATQVDNSTTTSEFLDNDGRFITVDDTHVYVSGQTTAFDDNQNNGFLVKFPKTGDCDGHYDHWTLMNDAYDIDRVYASLTADITLTVATGEFGTWDPDYESQWWDPSAGDSEYQTLTTIRDRDGGAIEFADGTRQTTSAQMIPQRRVGNGRDVRLTLEDMGKHIYVTDSGTSIAVPYSEEDVPLPIGYTVVIINNSGGTISVDGDGGNISIIVPGVQSATYWDLASPGMATLIKVDQGTWFMTGNVQVD